MKKSFTLAEIMIALTIIGIITAILLPVAIQTTPNEKVMKFKKANATLAKVINELVTSGEYYAPGDLGRKSDGSWVEETNYLCNTIADILVGKNIRCEELELKVGAGVASEDWECNHAAGENYNIYKSLDEA